MGVVQVSAEETQVQLQVTLRGIILLASENIVLARERPARERLKNFVGHFSFSFFAQHIRFKVFYRWTRAQTECAHLLHVAWGEGLFSFGYHLLSDCPV